MSSDENFVETREPTSPHTNGGCLLYGCLSVGLLGGLICFIFGVFCFLGYMLLDQNIAYLQSFAAEDPVLHEDTNQSNAEHREKEAEKVIDRLYSFLHDKNSFQLRLTESEVNALFQRIWSRWAKKELGIQGEAELKLASPNFLLRWSVPLRQFDRIDLFGFLEKYSLLERFLNLDITMRLRIRDGLVLLGLENFQVGGALRFPVKQYLFAKQSFGSEIELITSQIARFNVTDVDVEIFKRALKNRSVGGNKRFEDESTS